MNSVRFGLLTTRPGPKQQQQWRQYTGQASAASSFVSTSSKDNNCSGDLCWVLFDSDKLPEDYQQHSSARCHRRRGLLLNGTTTSIGQRALARTLRRPFRRLDKTRNELFGQPTSPRWTHKHSDFQHDKFRFNKEQVSSQISMELSKKLKPFPFPSSGSVCFPKRTWCSN